MEYIDVTGELITGEIPPMKKIRRILKCILLITILVLTSCNEDMPDGPFTPDGTSAATVVTQTIEVTPARLQEGSVLLYASREFPESSDASIDLDTGATWEDLINADIKFGIDPATESFFFQPINGAKVSPPSTFEPGIVVCKQRLPSFSLDHILNPEIGFYFCVLTNEGHLAQLQVEKLHHLGKGSVQIHFITWGERFQDALNSLATRYPVTVAPLPPAPTRLPSTSTPDPEIPIHHTGLVRLHTGIDALESEALLNLDGEIISDAGEYDIQFVVSRGGGSMYFYFLLPINKALAEPIGVSSPGFTGCKRAVEASSPVGIDNIYPGLYLCAVTTEGRLAQLRIEAMELSEGWIEISFLTWDEVVESKTP